MKTKDLTSEAGVALRANDHEKLSDLLKAAEKLQKHNERLFAIIDRTERKLAELVRRAGKQAREVNPK